MKNSQNPQKVVLSKQMEKNAKPGHPGLKSKVRDVPNWPIEGVIFRDITTLLQDADSFRKAVDSMVKPFKDKKIDKVVGIDARGFLLAAPVAYVLHAGMSIVRKPGKLPHETIEQKYTLEYGSSIVQIHKDAILPGEKILVVDDLIATGGTALAACDLIEKLKGNIVGIGCVIDLPFLGGSAKLKEKGYDIHSLITYDKE